MKIMKTPAKTLKVNFGNKKNDIDEKKSQLMT